MLDQALGDVRRKLVRLMRVDPPVRARRLDPRALPPVLDRWFAAKFTPEELDVIFRFEHLYGEDALSEWFAEALVEAGLVEPRRLAG